MSLKTLIKKNLQSTRSRVAAFLKSGFILGSIPRRVCVTGRGHLQRKIGTSSTLKSSESNLITWKNIKVTSNLLKKKKVKFKKSCSIEKM